MTKPNYAELLSEIGGILTASEREVFATKAIIRLSEQNDDLVAACRVALTTPGMIAGRDLITAALLKAEGR